MIRFTLFTALAVLLTGCYTLQPASGVGSPVGTRVAFDVNDAGRVALGGTMGPEIGQIEGRLLNADNGDYLIAVTVVRLLRGGEQVWRGERVRIKPEHVGNTYELRFSRARTIALSATIVGGVAAFVLGRGLFEPGDGDGPSPPVEPVPTRIVRP